MVLERAMRSCLAALAVTAACSFDALGAPSDLTTILNEALANDPVYASARFSQEASAEAEPQARSALLPNASLQSGINATYYHFVIGANPTGVQPYGQTFISWGPALQVAVPLYRAQLWDSLSQSKLTVQQSEFQFAQAREDLIVRVAQAYFDVLASHDALIAIQTNKQAISEQLAQAQREFEVGTKTIVDTHEAKSRYDQAVAQEQVALGDVIVKKSALRAIIGREVGDLAPLREAPDLVAPQPADVEAWAHNAEENNFTVLAAHSASEAARWPVPELRPVAARPPD